MGEILANTRFLSTCLIVAKLCENLPENHTLKRVIVICKAKNLKGNLADTFDYCGYTHVRVSAD
ncbi:hypothetical protein FRC0190_00898 [Corynebacterium rouxii]|uniref:Uncharacterized protein n=1 Tax=Corynebacterium rouxii TaxID=2719119 RepID=A0A6I8MGQ5_9CORY|nr:hypothetical protein FRC0190_00898 [Corynebacterium rouxii]